MDEQELRSAIASLRRVAQQMRADRHIGSAIELERGPLADRERELAELVGVSF